jgi:hypothetical protein
MQVALHASSHATGFFIFTSVSLPALNVPVWLCRCFYAFDLVASLFLLSWHWAVNSLLLQIFGLYALSTFCLSSRSRPLCFTSSQIKSLCFQSFQVNPFSPGSSQSLTLQGIVLWYVALTLLFSWWRSLRRGSSQL